MKLNTGEQITTTRTESRVNWIVVGLVAVLVVLAGAFIVSKRSAEKHRASKLPVPVTTALAVTRDVPLQVRSIGNVVPMNSVSVKSRVGGRITGVHFQEGQFVKHRDLLFTVDPRPLRAEYSRAVSDVLKQEAVIAQAKAAISKDKAALLQVKANMNKDMALAKLADVQAQRFGELARAGAVSELDAETRATDKSSTMAVVEADRAIIETASAQILADRANLKNADAQLASAKAALENARVQLNFTTVNAPITGRTGKILVLKGNNIRADEDILVTINQIAPIYVEFAVPDEQFGLVQRYGMNALKARAILNGHEYREGRITFTDNTVDNTTGTVKLKAIFDNTDSALWPGKYVDVILTLDTLHGAVVVPDHSISTGQSGQFVWVVKNDVARMQQVKTGPSVDGYTAIESGVSAGDVIVTDGQLQLSEGAKVQIAGQPQ